MKKHTKTTHLLLILALASTSCSSLFSNKPPHAAEKPQSASTFSVDVNFSENRVQSALISTVGCAASIAALALMYKGTVSYSAPQHSDQKLHTPTLFGGGISLLAVGLLTIFHPQVIDYLNS